MASVICQAYRFNGLVASIEDFRKLVAGTTGSSWPSFAMFARWTPAITESRSMPWTIAAP